MLTAPMGQWSSLASKTWWNSASTAETTAWTAWDHACLIWQRQDFSPSLALVCCFLKVDSWSQLHLPGPSHHMEQELLWCALRRAQTACLLLCNDNHSNSTLTFCSILVSYFLNKTKLHFFSLTNNISSFSSMGVEIWVFQGLFSNSWLDLADSAPEIPLTEKKWYCCVCHASER